MSRVKNGQGVDGTNERVTGRAAVGLSDARFENTRRLEGCNHSSERTAVADKHLATFNWLTETEASINSPPDGDQTRHAGSRFRLRDAGRMRRAGLTAARVGGRVGGADGATTSELRGSIQIGCLSLISSKCDMFNLQSTDFFFAIL